MLLFLFAMAAPLPAGASLNAEAPIIESQAKPVEGLFRIGKMGIYCARQPCPWRGIALIGRDGRLIGRPLWVGEELPTIKADPDTQRRIARSWRDFNCLTVQGRFKADALTVEHVVGNC